MVVELAPSFSRIQQYQPSRDEVIRLAHAGYTVIPVYRVLNADLETPVSVFLKVAQGRYGFLLESVEGGERLARYSFIGTDPAIVLTCRDGLATLQWFTPLGDSTGLHHRSGGLDYYGGAIRVEQRPFTDPLTLLQSLLTPLRPAVLPGLPRFLGGAVGYISYEAVRYFERIPTAPQDPLAFPDACFQLVTSMVIVDHIERTMTVVAHAVIDDPRVAGREYDAAVARIEQLVERLQKPPLVPVSMHPLSSIPILERLQANLDQSQYEAMVEQAKAYIAAGDIIQVVLSRRLATETGAHPFTIYRALRRINPSPYMFFLQFDRDVLIGASPEMLVRLDGDQLSMHPIAGTRPRGKTPEEDEALARELLADEKERAEHIMLVDLGRNDIGRVSEPGTVRVPRLMEIERYSHVMHLVSQVTGTLRADLSGIDALRACFPAGTVSGAPKIRAMEIIAELEPEWRGPYAGAVGYVDFTGNLDAAITIRTIVMRDAKAYLQAGAGIVADSIPEREFQETWQKLRAIVRALELGEAMERVQREGGEV
jgi:anthranilate synthase component 1